MSNAKRQPHADRMLAAWAAVKVELRKSIDELTFRISLAPDGAA